jgi:hypothetical protein
MTSIKKALSLTLITLLLAAVVGVYAVQVIRQGANAYLFGYPLVLMELTRDSMASEAESGRGANHLYHMRNFPDASFRQVVRPNNDTLYSVTWFDLSRQPMIISTPTTDRYYVLPFMDAWTNVFASIGTYSTGKQAGNYALVGPSWSGELPADIKKISSPTNMVWMIGRIQTNSKEDIAAVAAIQDQLSITPLDRWQLDEPYPATIISMENRAEPANPQATIDELGAQNFFNRLSYLMDAQPPTAADQEAVANLANFSIFPGQEFDLQLVAPLQRQLLVTGMKMANQKLHEATESKESSPKENGWTVWRDTIGNYGTNYAVRAGVALAGLGALSPAEAVYPTTHIDSTGLTLTGSNRYRIHFDTAPPAEAFWSLTMYDTHGFLVANPINRYTIGDRDSLRFNTDGSLDILIQHQQPDSDSTNWLPAPEQDFSLTLRIYRPTPAFISGKWQLPAVEKLD